MRVQLFALFAAFLVSGGALGPASAAAAMSDAAMASHGRYAGTPDLQLTSAMLAAGGGATHFHGAKLSAMLTGPKYAAEVAALTKRFGAQRMQQYFVTFDAFIGQAVGDAVQAQVALPPANAALATNPYELAASLRSAGVMPDGRFDVGYLVEHLVSRPIHIAVMNQLDNDPAIGPKPNADFHVIFTAEMNDLKSLYHLPR